MKFKVNGILYDCILTAWTPIRFYLKFRQSFITEWGKINSLENFDLQAQKELLTKLFYIAINNKDLPFAKFQAEAEADENFFSTAFLLFTMIYENNSKKRKSNDCGIEYTELTFLAVFGKSGLPEKVLDELLYFDIIEIFAIQGDLADPKLYEYKMATPEERKMAFGITEQDEAELEKFLLGGEGIVG